MKLQSSMLISFALLACSSPPDARSSADAQAIESGGRRAPTTDEERQLLDAIAAAKPGGSAQLGKIKLAISGEYAAASGATCREVSIAGSARSDSQRLACGDAEGWFFVPSVEGAMSEGDL